MRKLLSLITVVGVAAAVAVPATAGAANDNLRVFVSNCAKQVYKPKQITVACADAGIIISKVKYSSYGAKTAKGTGTAAVNLCDPNCAAGKTKRFPVKFTLSKVTQCGDSYQFRRLTLTYTKATPPHSKKTIVQPYVCADAPTA